MTDSQPNRNSGNWLLGVEKCPKRATPCGNPLDADEAMRASQIRNSKPQDFLARQQADQALKHALNIASDCPQTNCPLEKYFGVNRREALEKLATSD